MTVNDSQSGTSPKKKRLPFKRTVERKALTNDAAPTSPKKDGEEDNDLEFFRRTNDVFPLVVEEVEQAVKLGKIVSPIKRRRSSLDTDDESPRIKRPSPDNQIRTPNKAKPKHAVPPSDSSDDDLIMDLKGKGKEIYRPSKTPTPRKPVIKTSPGSRVKAIHVDDDPEFVLPSPRNTRQSTRIAAQAIPSSREAPINILDSSDDDVKVEVRPKVEEEEEDDNIIPEPEPEDEEVSKWAAKARELQAKNQDAIITIVVTSDLPNAQPLMVRRRAGQSLGFVLSFWVKKQRDADIRVSDDVEKSLFLTWRKKKVYNSSTATALGIRVDANGQLEADGDGYYRGGLHLEVWTEEAYQDYLKEKEQEKAAKSGFFDWNNVETEAEREPSPVPVKRKGVKLVLKAKDLEPFKLVAHDDTTVGTLIRQFKKVNQAVEGKSVVLYLDGEMLEEDSLIMDADIDPDETNQLEVHIK